MFWYRSTFLDLSSNLPVKDTYDLGPGPSSASEYPATTQSESTSNEDSDEAKSVASGISGYLDDFQAQTHEHDHFLPATPLKESTTPGSPPWHRIGFITPQKAAPPVSDTDSEYMPSPKLKRKKKASGKNQTPTKSHTKLKKIRPRKKVHAGLWTPESSKLLVTNFSSPDGIFHVPNRKEIESFQNGCDNEKIRNASVKRVYDKCYALQKGLSDCP